MKPSHPIRLAFFAAALAVLAAGPVGAQTAGDLFDASTLQEVRISMSTRDRQQLQARFDENTHYPAEFQWRNVRVRNVSVRSRGTASRNATKPGLEIGFDHYVSAQQFLGMRFLVLDNLWQDPAMIRERVAMALFNQMGEPAPRESFARVYLNNVFLGVYALVEAIDSGFVSRRFDETNAYLFEYRFTNPFYGGYPGDDLQTYKKMFAPRAHQLEADTTLFSPVRDLFREVNHPDDAVWRESVEKYIDLAQFVRQAAIEMFVSEHDGLLGYAGMNNFYLFRPVGSTRHRIVVWDLDLSFRDFDSSIFLRTDENELFRRAIAYGDLHDLYLQVLEDCARQAMADEWLLREMTNSAALIADAAHADQAKPFSNDDFDSAVAWMKEFASQRPLFVLRAVADARQPK